MTPNFIDQLKAERELFSGVHPLRSPFYSRSSPRSGNGIGPEVSMLTRYSVVRWRVLLSVLLITACGQQQKYDSKYDTSVSRPTYADRRPSVLFDEAHRNRHRADATYKPFAELIANDGYTVKRNWEPFTATGLAGHDVLVLACAMGANDQADAPALTEAEADAVEAWVRAGGSLLFITDHYPFGTAVKNLAGRFGVEMSEGITEDSAHHDPSTTDASQLLFSRENGLLADGPIARGRNASERVDRVVSFTGQSLRGQGTPLLRLSPTAVNRAPNVKVERSGNDSRVTVTYGDPVPATGYSQGLAFELGKGRVVVLGEAGMLSAQLDREGRPFGMNAAGNENRQFVLNTMHWLSRLLP